jgi:hypothetical protein
MPWRRSSKRKNLTPTQLSVWILKPRPDRRANGTPLQRVASGIALKLAEVA